MEISGRQVLAFGAIGVVALAVGFWFGGQEAPTDTASVIEDPTGEFEQIGLADSELDSPFKGLNGFENITVDDTATNDELTNASFYWNVKNATDLGLEERTSVAHFETDGALNEVEVELTDAATDDAYDGNVSIQDVTLYDYEAATDADSLDSGVIAATSDFSPEDFEADADVGTLRDGEYALVTDYKFESGESSPTTAQVDDLHTLGIEGDGGDVDTIANVPIGVSTYE